MPAPEAWPVARTMRALEVLAFQPLSAPQVAEKLGIHPRTARRLLNRLRDEGYLNLSDDGHRLYAPTMRLVSLAGQVAERSRLVHEAEDLVARLSGRPGTEAHLAVPSHRSIVCIVHGESGGPVESRIRELQPCHCTALGKVLLAHRQAWRDSVLRAPRLRSCTRATLINPALVREDVDQVRARGYAIEDGEHRSDIRGVAAPVFAPDGEAIAALGISTTGEEPVEELAGAVVPAAHTLTARLEGSDGG